MSLFKCMRCGVIENTNLVNPKHKETQYNVKQSDTLPFYPNMSLMDMHGVYGEDIVLNGIVWKKATEVLMLCCKCNTGEEHNEFEYSLADKEETKIASYSKYNMITPGDHEPGTIKRSGLSYPIVHPQYELLHAAYRELFNKKHTDNISHCKNNFKLLYDVFAEDPDNFSLYHAYDETDWDGDPYDALLVILDSLIDEHQSKSETLKRLLKEYMPSYGRMFFNTAESYSRKPKGKHWKVTQPYLEKENKLRLAEEKRVRKIAKKKGVVHDK